eukprot:CAMPEP_0182474878 /NCGR_PEP_ID=MMETSP1319-20130603/26425_1 /TAXON_ID=172717 /ORGANISM="Bolidomonas pacifica, Strain RCC208" /LENGTH=626 /DNA_ID=CAMNT_0024675815 /DNA_START=157 /DNA_END=2033 /DNA_ORIENTATION=-
MSPPTSSNETVHSTPPSVRRGLSLTPTSRSLWTLRRSKTESRTQRLRSFAKDLMNCPRARAAANQRPSRRASSMLGKVQPAPPKFYDAIRALAKESREVSDLVDKFDWFLPFLDEIRSRRLSVNIGNKSSLPLEQWNEANARQAARALTMSLAMQIQPQTAVDEWILQSVAVKELVETEEHFRLLMESLTEELMKRVPWGMRLRAMIGAGVAMADLASDLLIVFTFHHEGSTTYRNTATGMIATSFGLQLMMIILVHGQGGPGVLLCEVAKLFSGLKPAFDAYAVGTGAERPAYAVFDPFTEMVGARMMELFSEAIPMAVLQIVFIIQARTVDPVVATSLLISALTAGYTAASVTYDFDTDPKRRLHEPDFYGFIPDSNFKRIVALNLLVLQSTLMLLLRATATALILKLGGIYLLAFIAIDMSLFFLFKVAHCDFLYWIPVESLLQNIGISVLMRSMFKVICDFTGVLQFRHPNELGGMLWTVNTAVAHVVSIAAAYVYIGNNETTPEFESFLKTAVFSLVGLWFLVFLCLLKVSKKGYRKTFFDTRTAAQVKFDAWKDARAKNDDELSINTFCGVRSHIYAHFEQEAKAFLARNWERWEEEDAPFWNFEMITNINVNLLPLRLV